jgi:hypothetical protein
MQHIFSLINPSKSIDEKDVDLYLKEPYQKKLREEIDKLMFQIVLNQTNVYKFPIANDVKKIDDVYHKAYVSGRLVFGVRQNNDGYIDEYKKIEHYTDVIIGFVNNSSHPLYIDLKMEKLTEFPQMIIEPNSYKPIFNGRVLPYSCIPYEHLMWKTDNECDITIIYGILRIETRNKLYGHIIMYEKFYDNIENDDNKNDIVIKSGYLHKGNYPNLYFDGSFREIIYL